MYLTPSLVSIIRCVPRTVLYYYLLIGLASTNEDMSALVYSWSNSEAQLAEPIRKMAGIFEANASALSSLVSIRTVIDYE